MYRAQVATENGAARVFERLRLAVSLGGELAIAEVVLQAAAILRPVFVERSYSQQIGNINLVDELIRLGNQSRHQVQPLGIDGRHFIHIDRAGNSAHKIIRVRILATEHCVNLDNFLLPFQRVKVMRHTNQVHLGRQLVSRVAPIAVGKNAQPAGGECLDLVLHFSEIRCRVLVPR